VLLDEERAQFAAYLDSFAGADDGHGGHARTEG
jgi:hypothetical protein